MGVEIVFYATVVAYATAAILFFRYLAKPAGTGRAGRTAPRVLALAAVMHATYVSLASIVANICPVKSIHFVASIAALLATSFYLAMRLRWNIDALGAFVAPVALTFVLGSRFVGVADQGIGGGMLALHVTVNVLGDALFLLASGTAVLYLVEERRLKQKRASSVFGKLPALDALDRAEHRLLLTGFPLLTLGIITGTAWANRLETGGPAEMARALFAYGTWLLFAGVLVLRALLGWRGRRAAYGTIAGFLFAVAVLVVYFVRGPLGGRGGRLLIVVVGLSHREAPLEVRERLAVDGEGVAALLRALLRRPSIREALCVSTCNRIELYAVGQQNSDEHTRAAAEDVHNALVELAGRSAGADIAPFLKTHFGRDAVLHLFRVASSLDSLVIGEPQILGQVRDALEAAKTVGSIGKYLDRATNRALHVAKRVRSDTAIGEGQVSVASVAVDLARQIFGDLEGRTALLVGAGEMAEGAAKQLVKAGAKLVVVNRSLERGRQVALEFGGTARPWEELTAALVQTDVVIASTSAKGFVVTRATTVQAMKARRGRSLFFIDIAVPRDIDPAVNKIDNVYLYDIDNLSNLVAESMLGRRAEAERAETLVQHEANAFESWTETLGVTATIVALRAKVRASLAAEVERTVTGRLKHLGENDRKALETMIDAAVNKLLHAPTSRIKELAGDPRGEDLVKAVHHLFDLTEAVREIDAAQTPGAEGKDDTRDPKEPAGCGTSTPPGTPNEIALGAPGGRETAGR